MTRFNQVVNDSIFPFFNFIVDCIDCLSFFSPRLKVDHITLIKHHLVSFTSMIVKTYHKDRQLFQTPKFEPFQIFSIAQGLFWSPKTTIAYILQLTIRGSRRYVTLSYAVKQLLYDLAIP